METKLKTLKVVDLRAILAKSNVSFPTRATKQDLIARIVDSPTATQVYHQLHTGPVLPSPEQYVPLPLPPILVFLPLQSYR